MAEEAVPHVLMFPFPAQGHVLPMLKLAELLSQASLHVTFVNTEHFHHRFQRHSDLDRLVQRPGFRFRTIPDGLPNDDPRPSLKFLELEESLRSRSREMYRELLVPSNGRDSDGWPSVTCVVADGTLPLALEVAEEMDVPVMLLRTSSACSLWACYCIPELIKRGELPFQEKADMDEAIQGVAGMESFLRRRDLPGLMRHAKSTTDRVLQLLNTMSTNLTRGRALILNTFESLESPVLSRICSICPVTYALGPLHVLNRTFGSHGPNNEDTNIASIPPSSSNPGLWHEDRTCMTWLDSQPHKSVVYVSFGSVTVVSREELLEFWHGLVNSGQRFLWVVRPDLVEGKTGASGFIPPEVEEGTRERGCLVEWAPQEEVLAHPAVGCFLTHSGWNSTLESMVAGVPMICWPFSADQQINSRFVSEIWKIGVDMKDSVGGRSIVEMMVRKAMEGEGAEELRRSACEMAKVSRRSAEEGGSSYRNFQRLIQHIKSFSARTIDRSNK